jgi:proline iminopeptidase
LTRRGLGPPSYVDALWGFQLTAWPEARTRLVVSGYAAARPRLLQALADLVFWEPAHWVMQTRQFANLKRRAERQPFERARELRAAELMEQTRGRP